MATDVIMPALGMAQEKGTLVNWLKAEGEAVTKGEPLMEVETDKATVEIEAPASGILANLTAAIGDKVPVGERIAVILAPGESLPETTSTSPPQAAATQTLQPKSTPAPEARPTPERSRIAASPLARRIAQEKGVDLAALPGKGPEGRIIAENVLRAAE